MTIGEVALQIKGYGKRLEKQRELLAWAVCHNVNQGGMRSGRALQMRDLIKQGRAVLAGKSSEQISKHIDEMGRRNAERLKELNNVA